MAKRKKENIKLYMVILGVAISLAVLAGFFIFQNNSESLYVYPENPKQGDTVFIKVESQSGKITGSFEKEKLLFYKKNNSAEWVAFLGIDADKQPGEYKISVNIPGREQLTKKIKVNLADFSTAPVVTGPTVNKNGITLSKAVKNIVKNDNPAIKKILDNPSEVPYFTKSFLSPLIKMEKGGLFFGEFIKLGTYKIQHLGVDLSAPEETSVYSINNGKVVATLDLYNYGKTIIIDHGLGIFSMYLHLEEFKVSKGQIVKRGQIIGLSGSTGYVTAPHLHFSMRVDGARVDPIDFIKETQKMDDNSFLAGISNVFNNIFK